MALDPNRWTLKTQEAFNAGVELARSRSNPEVTPDHLLAGMLGQEGTAVLPVLQKVGMAPLSLRNKVEDAIGKLPRSFGSDAQMGRELREVLERADKERGDFGDEYLSVEHLLLALADRVGVKKDDLLVALRDVRGSHRVTSQNPEDQYQALEKYGRDLTEEARKGKLDPVIGRDEEIRRVIQVLSRRTKNNPVLIGEPGVGETAVEDSIAILRGLKERYEVHHGVRIQDAALVAAAVLSNRYVTGRFLPDKAIDLVDEAASKLRIEIDSMPTEIDVVERRMRQLEIERVALGKETDQASKERLEVLDRELADLRERADGMKAHWQQEKDAITAIRALKEELEAARMEAERETDLERAAEIRYGQIPELERRVG